ncbi:MAG: hypothetical protein ORO03_10990, partial [Alphaproteobacteria bacterium]|nr:hypothetical protein [Alphaproteobacteria bacterium]
GSLSLDNRGGAVLARDVSLVSNGGQISLGSRLQGAAARAMGFGLSLNAGDGGLRLAQPLGLATSLGWLEITTAQIVYDQLLPDELWFQVKGQKYGRLQPVAKMAISLGLSH